MFPWGDGRLWVNSMVRQQTELFPLWDNILLYIYIVRQQTVTCLHRETAETCHAMWTRLKIIFRSLQRRCSLLPLIDAADTKALCKTACRPLEIYFYMESMSSFTALLSPSPIFLSHFLFSFRPGMTLLCRTCFRAVVFRFWYRPYKVMWRMTARTIYLKQTIVCFCCLLGFTKNKLCLNG